MELKEFIKQVLADIANAVKESQDELKDVAVINAPNNSHEGVMTSTYFYDRHNINFDVAVSASSEKDKSAGVRVLSSIGGGVSVNTTSQESSRITFSIPVYLSRGLVRGLDKLQLTAGGNDETSCVQPTATIKEN